MSDSNEFSAVDFAIALHALGLSLFPLPAPVPGTPKGKPGDGKTPALPWGRYQTVRATEDQVKEWFSERKVNVAIVTGAISGVVVVDTDSRDAEKWARARLPPTPWRVQTANGWHRYFKHPGTPVRNKARLETGDGRIAVDVRGDGGFVVGPGSRHMSGAVYTPRGNWSVPASGLPTFWPGWIERPRPQHAPRSVPASVLGLDAVARARAYLRAMPRPVVGQGSDATTFSAAARLVRGFRLDADTALALLVEWAPADFDRWWIEAKVRSAQRYATEPEGALLEVQR